MRTEPGPLDRLLRPFADVRAGESPTALLLMLNVFVLLTSYYLVKVLREPLILLGGGAEVKSYSAAGQAVLLLFLVPAYGALAARLPRRRLINAVTAVFVLCLVAFFLLARLGVPIGVPFYLWVGIFNMMIVAQFWAFANDVYTIDEGKRLFPIVAFGASSGAAFGSWVAIKVLASVGLHAMFPIAAALLVLSAFMTGVVDRRERRRTESRARARQDSGTMPAATPLVRTATGEFQSASPAYQRASGQLRALSAADLEAAARASAPKPAKPNAFAMVFGSRYLLMIALMILCLNYVNSTGEYLLGRTIRTMAAGAAARGEGAAGDIIGGYYASYFFAVNVLGMVVQLFVVSRVIKHLGVRVGLLVLPVVALGGYAAIAAVPVLAVMRWAKTAENATDYSLGNTVRNALFLPTTREEKYAAKQVIDAFFVRMGDVLSAGVVFLGGVLAFAPRHFALVNLVFTLAAIGFAIAAGRRYERLVAVTP